jgi:TRAP-type C4-dicarboxylate transport system substrate-binding protein
MLRSVVLLSACLAVLFALAACGSPAAETTTTAAAPAQSSTTTAAPVGESSTTTVTTVAAPAKDLGDFEFSLSVHDPLASNNTQHWQAWADQINKATDGHVKIVIYPSGQLAAAADVGEMVETGGVDIGWLFTPFYKGQFPLTEVVSIPMVGFDNGSLATNVAWDLYEKYPEFQKEWSNYKLLNMYGIPASIFGTVGKPIATPADAKGMVLRSPAGLVTDLVTKLGASPVAMAPPDMYEALEKKNVAGYIFEPAGIQNFKLQEVTDYYTDLPIYIGVFGLVMNWDKWNSLPPEYQAIIESFSLREGSLAASADMQAAADKGHQVFIDAGAEWIVPTDEAKAAFKVIADEVAATWPKTVSLPGFDAPAYMVDALSILKTYK